MATPIRRKSREYYPELFESFVHLGCLYTILKGF